VLEMPGSSFGSSEWGLAPRPCSEAGILEVSTVPSQTALSASLRTASTPGRSTRSESPRSYASTRGRRAGFRNDSAASPTHTMADSLCGRSQSGLGIKFILRPPLHSRDDLVKANGRGYRIAS
jgi:hypothetical protein